jgi:hypothetical protein
MLTDDRDAGDGPAPPHRGDENRRRGTDPFDLGTGKSEGAAPAGSDAHTAPVAATGVDNHTTGRAM